MTEQNLTDLLERSGERHTVGPPPIEAMLTHSRRSRRRRATFGAATVSVAIGSVIVGSVLHFTQTGSQDPNRPRTTDALTPATRTMGTPRAGRLPDPKWLTPVTSPSRFGGGQVLESPPRTGDLGSAIDWRTVYEKLCDPAGATGVCEVGAGAPEVALARVTSDQIADRLVYVFTWRGFVCGGSEGSGPRGKLVQPELLPCVNRNFVDATNGKFLYAARESTDIGDASAPPATADLD